MPMVSQAQRRFLHARHPEIAKRFEEHTPKGVKLPEKVESKARKAAAELLASQVVKAAAYASSNSAKTAAQRLAARLRAGTSLKTAVDAVFSSMPPAKRISLENSIIKLACFELMKRDLSYQTKQAGLGTAMGVLLSRLSGGMRAAPYILGGAGAGAARYGILSSPE